MKKTVQFFILITILLTSFHSTILAQIPYFGNTVGKKHFYTYISTKFHPGHNDQIVYGNMAYGLFQRLDLMTEYYIGTNYGTQGFGLKYNILKSPHANIGVHSMVNFDIQQNYHFSFIANSLYVNGVIHGSWGYVSDSWYTEYAGGSRDFSQWTYLYHSIGRWTPMVGYLNSWTDPKLNCWAVGTYYNIKNINLYLWGSNLANRDLHPRIVVGFDIKF